MKHSITGLLWATATSVVLSGCATVFEGTSQEISVVSNPAGATCAFERQGMEVGRVQNTPGTANIRKSKYDLTVRCNKPGYVEATYLNHSGTTATIGANIAADLILTGGLSSIVDSADGADNKYDSVVNISMSPIAFPIAQSAPVYRQSAYEQNINEAPTLQRSVAACTKDDIETARAARESGFILRSSC
jgi:hypothetical protein